MSVCRVRRRCDGDVVFQPRKVQRSGLWNAVSGRVLIYFHKERILDAVQRHHPASFVRKLLQRSDEWLDGARPSLEALRRALALTRCDVGIPIAPLVHAVSAQGVHT